MMVANDTNGPSRPAYRADRAYEWNVENAPAERPSVDVPVIGGDWEFLGRRLNSPLGIPAGPLVNSQWLLYYASLGFDVLTYKTVRSGERPCYELPNLLPVSSDPLREGGGTVEVCDDASGPFTWAVSMGMPSAAPEVWRPDVERARDGLGDGQMLVVSVVGTPQPGWSLEDLAKDYAICARWASEAGAHAVEANISCPNVQTAEGQIYLSPESSSLVCSVLREAVGDVPLILKIGLFDSEESAETFVDAAAPHVNALSTVNCINARVRYSDGRPAFDGVLRGIAGDAIRERSIEQVAMLRRICDKRAPHLSIIGVGGISTAEDVRSYLSAGATIVEMATAPMRNPEVALRLRNNL